MIRILLGGSPCTHWSIAQSKNRETEPSGEGWELFKNYLIAKEKFRPDIFLYENNKSAAPAIKNQISKELGVDLMYINSALVSAQNRQRFYCFNWTVEQPEDRGILLADVLESGGAWQEKSYCLTASYWKGGQPWNTIERKQRTLVAEAVIYNIPHDADVVVNDSSIRCQQRDKKHSSVQGKHIYLPNAKTGTLMSAHIPMTISAVDANTKTYPVYEVKGGLITIKGKQYEIKLPDGYYIIRKLTPVECERLQTLPDNYTAGISNTQRYKCLGNGWTAEVIIHILRGAFRHIPRDERIEVLSMYDGIATGRYCLDKLGFKNVRYYAYEIDKYAKQVAMNNYPDIIQCGDAFRVRDDDWGIEGLLTV